MDILNTLCGAEPAKWIDKSSHNKLIRCSTELKDRMQEIASRYSIPDIGDFFNSQPTGSYLAFLREGTFLRNDNNLVRKAVFIAANTNFNESYDIIAYGDKETYTGPADLNTCVCRFCKRSYPEVRFKKRNAHAIPDALGNELIFCNDECMTCNHDLSGVDKELTEYLKVRRSEYKILNKKNKVIQVWGHNFFYDGPTGELKISKLAILEERADEYYVKLEGADPITHFGIYKALAKAAIDIMPRNLVESYPATVDWITGRIVPASLPNVFYSYHDSAVKQPKAKIFIRKSSATLPGLPRCIAALTITDLTYIFIVPLGDGEPMYSKDYLARYLPFLFDMIYKPGEDRFFEKLDMEDKTGKFSHVKEWVKKRDCKIVDQSEFEHTQEKNPDKVDFPPFDASKASICDCRADIEYMEADRKITENLKIESSYAHIIDSTIGINEEKNEIQGFWKLGIETLGDKKSVLTANCRVYATYEKFSDICSKEFGEISPYIVEFMLDEVCKKIRELTAVEFPEYDFSRLTTFLMEAVGNILHPQKGAEQSVMTGYAKKRT